MEKNLKLKYTNRINKPALTEEIKKNILDNVFQPLLNHIDEELSEFYSLFDSFKWEEGVAQYKYDNIYEYYVATLFFSKELKKYDKYKYIFIVLQTKQFVYNISVYYDFISSLPESKYLLYTKDISNSESLTKHDLDDIVNIIGHYWNDFLESDN